MSFFKVLSSLDFNLKHLSRIVSGGILCRCLPRTLPVTFTVTCRNYYELRDHNSDFFRKQDKYQLTTVQNIFLDEAVKSDDEASIKVFDVKNNPDSILDYLEKQQSISSDDIKKFLAILMKRNFRLDRNFIMRLDQLFCNGIHEWDLDHTLYVFDALLLILNFSAFSTSYFMKACSIWTTNLDKSSKSNVLQIMYYMSLSKKASSQMMRTLSEKLVTKEDSVSDFEWAVACLSLFRTKTKVEDSAFLSKCVEVGKNLMTLKENFHLISVLKCLRQAQFYDEQLWQQLQGYIKEQYKNWNFVECNNFLAVLSTQNVFDCVYGLVEEHCAEILASEVDLQHDRSRSSLRSHPSVRSRTKDIARFLWSMSNVGHEPNQTTIDIILTVLRAKKNTGEYYKEPHFLVDCLQSLSILKSYPPDLLEEVFSKSFLKKIWQLPRVKPRYQLYFIYKSCEIECRQVYQNIIKETNINLLLKSLPDNSEKQRKHRAELNKIISLLKRKNILNKYSAECCFVLPHIAISGILLSDNTTRASFESNRSNESFLNSGSKRSLHKVYIELLDSTVCCRNSFRPLGFMETKIRQLQTLGQKVLILKSCEIDKIEQSPDSAEQLQTMIDASVI